MRTSSPGITPAASVKIRRYFVVSTNCVLEIVTASTPVKSVAITAKMISLMAAEVVFT